MNAFGKFLINCFIIAISVGINDRIITGYYLSRAELRRCRSINGAGAWINL